MSARLADEEQKETQHERRDNNHTHGNKVLLLDGSGDPDRRSVFSGTDGLGARCAAVAGTATDAFYRFPATTRDGFAGPLIGPADAAEP